MSQFDDDMAATVEYFNGTTANTSAAKKVKDDFATWYSNLGWYDKSVNSDQVWNQARNFRTQFNRANAVTPAEVAAVAAVEGTGLSTEQTTGKPQAAKTSSGLYAAPSTSAPLIPTEYKVFAGVAAVGVVLILTYGVATSALPALAGYFATKKRSVFP